ncbi:hypothetical protein ACQKWADRAFT_288358 [Trichoderma austrokoningii]
MPGPGLKHTPSDCGACMIRSAGFSPELSLLYTPPVCHFQEHENREGGQGVDDRLAAILSFELHNCPSHDRGCPTLAGMEMLHSTGNIGSRNQVVLREMSGWAVAIGQRRGKLHAHTQSPWSFGNSGSSHSLCCVLLRASIAAHMADRAVGGWTFEL